MNKEDELLEGPLEDEIEVRKGLQQTLYLVLVCAFFLGMAATVFYLRYLRHWMGWVPPVAH